MRTTVNLDDDVSAAIDRLRREKGLGLSETVNELARQGMERPASDREYVYQQPSFDMGMRVDSTCIGEVLDQLDQLDDEATTD